MRVYGAVCRASAQLDLDEPVNDGNYNISLYPPYFL